MSDTKLRDILTDIHVATARTDERLQIVIDEQKSQGADIDTLKTQRSWIVGAYFSLCAAVSLYWSTRK